MTPEKLDALRARSHAGDRNAELRVRAGDLADLIDELDACAFVLDCDNRVLALARKIGQHWREQEGVNGALLDQLAELTK